MSPQPLPCFDARPQSSPSASIVIPVQVLPQVQQVLVQVLQVRVQVDPPLPAPRAPERRSLGPRVVAAGRRLLPYRAVVRLAAVS